MAWVKDFERRLHDLWTRRTVNLLSWVKSHHGRRKQFTKRHRERGIADLQALATDILSREGARDELRALTKRVRRRRIKGRGLDDRFDRLWTWAGANLRGPIIYSFWRGRNCLYVGKGRTWRRLGAYKRSAYLLQATSLRVRIIRSKSLLAKAECLSTHLFSPRDNAVKAARPRYSKHCPVCQANKAIREELRALFSFH